MGTIEIVTAYMFKLRNTNVITHQHYSLFKNLIHAETARGHFLKYA